MNSGREHHLEAILDAVAASARKVEPTEILLETVLKGTTPYQVRVAGASVAGDATQANEDAFAVVHSEQALVAGVFDGMTSLLPFSPLEERGLSGGQFVAQFLRLQFENAAKSDPATTLRSLNADLAAVLAQFDVNNPDEASNRPGSSATIARLDAASATLEIAHVYDSWCVVLYADGGTELLTEDRNASFDQEVLKLIELVAAGSGRTRREARRDKVVEDALIASRAKKINRSDGQGVGVINGDPNLQGYIQQRALPLDKVAALLLGTDGLLPQGWSIQDPVARLGLFETLEASGIYGLFELKKASEDADHNWQRNARFKHSDDATAVFIRIEHRHETAPKLRNKV